MCPNTTDMLRCRAEEQLKEKLSEAYFSGSADETQRLLHELQVHQIELQMQNEELRQVRNSLETALEAYTDLYDFAPIGYFVLDRNGTITTVNLSGAGLLGLERTRLLGRRFGLFIPVISQLAFAGFIEKVFASQGQESCELALTTDDHSMLFLQIEAVALESGQECRIAVTDITKLKRSEDALRRANSELEERVRQRTGELASSVETLREEIVDREKAEVSLQRLNRLYAVLSETNKAIVRAFDREYLAHDICHIAAKQGGFLLSWVGMLDEESGQIRVLASCGDTGYLEDIRVTNSTDAAGLGPTGIAVREGTYVICNDFQNDPRTRPWHERAKAYGIHSSASIALKEEGRVVGALSLYSGEKGFFDQQHVTLFRQMGSDVSFALSNIAREARGQNAEQALLEETLERLRAVEALRQRELIMIQQSRHAAMGEMIGNIAHQWRQPLNSLGLATQSLGILYGTPSFNKEFLDTSIAKSMEIIQYMSRTIDVFRNFFSTEREKSEFSVSEAVNSALSLVEAGFKEQRIKIELEQQGEISILGYPNEYAQVLLNIFINARDAIIDRNVRFPRLKIAISAENGTSLVTVADNAGGIPEEIINNIFDPYFTTKGPQHGTGLGLFMSKTIIENNMGGRITVRNTGPGTEFRIEV